MISAARKLPSSRNKHDDDQQRALGEVLRDGRDGRVHEFGAVEHGLDARRPAAGFALTPSVLASTAPATVRLLRADQHQGGADDDLLAVLAGAARAQLSADRRRRQRRCTRTGTPPSGGDDHVADLFHAFEAPGGAHDIAFAVALDVAGAAA